jgi:hypothetical protein
VTETVPPPMTQPAAPAAPAAPPLDNRERLFKELIEALKGGQTVQQQLLKEHTQAISANTRAMIELQRSIWGEDPTKENPQGVDGLMDFIHDLGESIEELDEKITGTNMMLARYSWVFDRLGEINSGTAEAPELEAEKEPEFGKVYREGRAPVFKDMVAALKEFDELAEKEALAEAMEVEKAQKEEEEKARATAAPAKTPMMGNAPPPKQAPAPPIFRKLPPPLPVAPPLPK